MDALHPARPLVACAIATLAASCLPAATMPDTAAIAAMVHDADQAGGHEEPSASFYLALAERELSRAEALVRARDAEGAQSWARRAQADADLARLLAVEAAVRAAAQRTEDDAAALFRALEGRPLEARP